MWFEFLRDPNRETFWNDAYWNVFQKLFCIEKTQPQAIQFTRQQFLQRLYMVIKYSKVEQTFAELTQRRAIILRNYHKIQYVQKRPMMQNYVKSLRVIQDQASQLLETQIMLGVFAEMKNELKCEAFNEYLSADVKDRIIFARPLFVTKASTNKYDEFNNFEYSIRITLFPWIRNYYQHPLTIEANCISNGPVVFCTISAQGYAGKMISIAWNKGQDKKVQFDKQVLRKTKDELFGSNLSDATYVKFLTKLLSALCTESSVKITMLSAIVNLSKKTSQDKGEMAIVTQM